jgi:hypothetical protein
MEKQQESKNNTSYQDIAWCCCAPGCYGMREMNGAPLDRPIGLNRRMARDVDHPAAEDIWLP